MGLHLWQRLRRVGRKAVKARTRLLLESLEDRTVPAGGVAEFGAGITGNPGGIIYNALDSKFYFDEQFQDTIGVFDPATGVSTEFPPSVTGIPAGFKPHNMKFVAPGQPGSQFGNVVFTGLGTDQAGNGPTLPFQPPNLGGLCFFNTVTHKATIFSDGITLLPGGVAPALHDSVFDAVDGNYYITEQIASRIALFNPTTQKFQEFALAPPGVDVQPHGILVLPNDITMAGGTVLKKGNLLYAAHQLNKIQVFDITTHAVTDVVTVPTPGALPHDPLIGGDGNLYFTEVFGNALGQFNFKTGQLTQIPIPDLPNNGAEQGVTLTSGPDNNSVWFVEFLASRIGKFDFATQKLTSYRIGITPHSGPLVINLARDLNGNSVDGNIWFSESVPPQPGTTTTGRIARLTPALADLDINNPNRGFTETIYNDLLHREADPGGLAAFTNQINSGTASLNQAVLAVETSHEGRIATVQGEYMRLLHRPADPTGLNAAVAFLEAGGSLGALNAVMFGSSEYFATRGGGTNQGFLAALYQDELNRPLDASGQATWGQALTAGASRSAVASAIIFSQEGGASVIAGLYGRFLFRGPDPSAVGTYSAALQQGVSLDAIEAAIISSQEYYSFRLFGPDQTPPIPGVLEV